MRYFVVILTGALLALTACRSNCVGSDCSDGRERRQTSSFKNDRQPIAACPTMDVIPQSLVCGRRRDNGDYSNCIQALDRRSYTC